MLIVTLCGAPGAAAGNGTGADTCGVSTEQAVILQAVILTYTVVPEVAVNVYVVCSGFVALTSVVGVAGGLVERSLVETQNWYFVSASTPVSGPPAVVVVGFTQVNFTEAVAAFASPATNINIKPKITFFTLHLQTESNSGAYPPTALPPCARD